jgi:ATP-dependent Clp protease adaptor protein ClpS
VLTASLTEVINMANSEVNNAVRPIVDVQEPPLFRVIYLNDEVTSMEFVVSTLVEYFNYNDDTAHNITMDIHEKGSAIVAVLPYEIAEQKGIEITLDARFNKYPLQVKVEADS